MSTTLEDRPLIDQLLEPLSRCIQGQGEDQLLKLRAGDALQTRIDWLAGQCDEGRLTPEERAEYETYVRFGNFLAILQAKARLRRSQAASPG